MGGGLGDTARPSRPVPAASAGASRLLVPHSQMPLFRSSSSKLKEPVAPTPRNCDGLIRTEPKENSDRPAI